MQLKDLEGKTINRITYGCNQILIEFTDETSVGIGVNEMSDLIVSLMFKRDKSCFVDFHNVSH